MSMFVRRLFQLPYVVDTKRSKIEDITEVSMRDNLCIGGQTFHLAWSIKQDRMNGGAFFLS